jgi:hypothetical protein
MARDELSAAADRSCIQEVETLRLPFVTRRKPMTRLIIVSTALIAAAAYQVQAAAARDVATRRAAAQVTADCVRAPAEGAFATAPYTEPPCLPKQTN